MSSSKAVESTLGAGEPEKVEKFTDNELEMKQHNENGVKLANIDMHEEAITEYDKAISGSADDFLLLPIFLCNRANSLTQLDKVDEAIADYVKTVKIDPTCVMAYEGHSNVYANKGKLTQALDLLR